MTVTKRTRVISPPENGDTLVALLAAVSPLTGRESAVVAVSVNGLQYEISAEVEDVLYEAVQILVAGKTVMVTPVDGAHWLETGP